MHVETPEHDRTQRSHRLLLLLGVVLVVAALVVVGALLWERAQAPTADGGGDGGGSVIRPIVIESVAIRIAESDPPQLFVDVQGYLPDSCTTAHEPEVTRDGNTFAVTILGERPPGVFCTQAIVPYQKSIALGNVEPGEYTVKVNDQVQTVTVQ
ncbi:MAG: hypothetical protein QJR03_13620 [Sphaerobacter sp.]|nr:hypothetical protein [Sphaerobacter sp.]